MTKQPRKPGRAAGDPAEEPGRHLDPRQLAPDDHRRPHEHVHAIEREQAAEHVRVELPVHVQQHPNSGEEPNQAAGDVRDERPPIDVGPQRPGHRRLIRDAARHHELHDANRIVMEMEQHRPAHRREREPGEARDHRRDADHRHHQHDVRLIVPREADPSGRCHDEKHTRSVTVDCGLDVCHVLAPERVSPTRKLDRRASFRM